MDAMAPQDVPDALLEVFSIELEAERAAMRNSWEEAAKLIQSLADRFAATPTEQGWYVQEKARYTYPISAAQSNTIQGAAHKLNTLLLKPKSGMIVSRIAIVSQKRVENIIMWVRQYAD